VDKIKDKQVIITCTDADEISVKGDKNLIHIKDGKII